MTTWFEVEGIARFPLDDVTSVAISEERTTVYFEDKGREREPLVIATDDAQRLCESLSNFLAANPHLMESRDWSHQCNDHPDCAAAEVHAGHKLKHCYREGCEGC